MKRYLLIAFMMALGAGVPAFAQSPFGKLREVAQVKTPTPALKSANTGTWWRDPAWVSELGLTPDQQRKMDDIFQQYRLRLIDLNAGLQKEELTLEPLIDNVRPGDEARVLAQIDRIAEARAELEKANARMLLAIRQALTAEQWALVSSSNSKDKVKAVEKSKFADPVVKGTTKEAPESPKLKKTP